MKKKPPVINFPKPMKIPDDRSWHYGGDIEIGLYARSLQKSAKTLIETLDLRPNPKTAWDACPVVLLYKQAVELQLKMLIDQGDRFLKEGSIRSRCTRPIPSGGWDKSSRQIVKAVQWESDFRCDGISTLADFTALIDTLETLDPVACSVIAGRSRRDGSVPAGLEPTNVVRFGKKLDGLLDLLGATTDALASKADQCADLLNIENIPPTVH
jgi:hypothetical protein